MDEMILVVSRDKLFNSESLAFQGTLIKQSQIIDIMDNAEKHVEVMRRGDAEENIRYKQIIPYVVIRRGHQIFMYKRLSGGGEARLHAKLSIGVGGHMNAIDGKDLSDTVFENMLRELNEELDIPSNINLKTVGLINDDNFIDPKHVGNVHLGILIVGDVHIGSHVKVRETDQLEGQWTTIEELHKPEVFDRLESWSQNAVKALS